MKLRLIANSFFFFSSLAGDIKFMDPRNPNSVLTVATAPNSQGMTAMAVHPKANLFAW
jgi:hypothetical protein